MFFFNWNDPQKNTDGNDQVAQQPPVQAQQSTQPVQPTQDEMDYTNESQTNAEPQTPYVDAYTPPAHLKHTPWTDQEKMTSEPNQSQSDASMQPTPQPPVLEDSGIQEDSDQEMQSVQMPISSPEMPELDDQSLEAQNIFTLLGVDDGTDEEKEAFLDELQQVVWEDFVENDSQALLTEEEYAEFAKIVENVDLSNEEMQEQALTYLEKALPNLEEIMLDKALELKREMVMERVAGMKEYYAGQDQQLDVIAKAEQQFAQDKWASGADTLNTLS